MYNDTCVSFLRLTKLSDSRKKAIRARLRQYDVEEFRKLFQMAEESGFLKGQNSRNWSASFDWLIKDANMAKVLDGNYASGNGKGNRLGGDRLMVEREKFKVLVKGMKAVYTHSSFIPDQDAFNVWYALLNDLSYEELNTAIQKHMMTNPHPPTIADLREAVAVLFQDEGEMSELKAWDMVRKAISNSGYHAEEEFDRLPEAIQIAVGNPANLREWAMMPTETVESVEQSHFIKAYRVAVGRLKEAAQMAPEIRELYVSGQGAEPKRIEKKH